MTDQRGAMRGLKKNNQQPGELNLNKSPYLVPTLGIYYHTFVIKIFLLMSKTDVIQFQKHINR